MKVVAVRDDGALLVAHGANRAAAIVSEDGSWLTTIDSALARGYWNDPGPSDKVPAAQTAPLIRALTAHGAQLPHNPFITEDVGNDD